MLQSVSSVFIVYRRETLTGSLDPTHANSMNKPCTIEPKYFIWVIQKKNGEIIDRQDGKHGEDQNIGLHDLVSQLSMHRVNVKQNVTILTKVDSGFCPFCKYHAGCHRTLNNHVQLHFRMPMFCGVGDCFYPHL